MVSTFFSPYIRCLIGAAYNVQQTLDGLDLHSSNFVEYGPNGHVVGSYWSASEAMLLPLGMLLIIAVLISIGLLLSGYVIGRWRGVMIVTLLLCLPGFASLGGIMPVYNISPSEYVVGGTGVLGEMPSMVPLVVLALAAGWSIAMVGIDLLDLGERYRNLFDHVWYAMAVITGLFFVGDNAAGRLDTKLAEVSDSRKFAAEYLVHQLRDYSAECRSLGKSQAISCKWASFAQQQLIEYSHWPSNLYSSLGPKSVADVYQVGWNTLTPDEIIALRREIRTINNETCPVQDLGNGVSQPFRPSNFCQRPPSDVCRAFSEPLDGSDGKDSMLVTTRVASECIVPTLVQFRQYEAKLVAQKQDVAESKHLRWLFYICFSMLAGAKVASATIKVVGIDKRPPQERQRLLGVPKWAFSCLRRGFLSLWRVAIMGIKWLCNK